MVHYINFTVFCPLSKRNIRVNNILFFYETAHYKPSSYETSDSKTIAGPKGRGARYKIKSVVLSNLTVAKLCRFSAS